MNYSKKNFVWIFLLFGVYLHGQTKQSVSIDEVAVRLITKIRADAAENIFIHTDKSIYKVGEKIWFNAFLVNKISHRITSQSRIVFVDLVNDKDSVIKQLVLDEGSLRLNGSIALPVTLQDGNYWLRGYTNYILQTDSSNICVHPVYIVNPQNLPAAKPDSGVHLAYQSSRLVPKVEMYPEGGSIIAGVTCVVAFRITDQNNNPLEAEGYLRDNYDTTITTFKTSSPGIGEFYFFPWKVRQYTAYIKTKEGRQISYPLPAADNYAANLSVESEDQNSFKVRVALGDFLYDKKTTTYLLGISRDSVCFSAIGDQMYEVFIPKRNFPQGEASLLLFDDQGKFLSERRIYIDLDSARVDVKPDKDNYLARENISLNLSIRDANDHPKVSLLSAAVTDNSSVKYFDDGDIDTVIKMPNSAEERNLGMIAQESKYRQWSQIGVAQTAKHPDADENFFNIHGTVVSKKNQPLSNIIVILVSSKPQNILEVDTSNENGRFNFNLPGYYDSTEFSFQLTDMKGKTVDGRIMFDPLLLPKFNTPSYLKRYLTLTAAPEIAKKKSEQQDFLFPGKGKLLAEVIVSAQKKPVNYDEKLRVSQFSKILTPDMITQYGRASVTNALLSVPGVQLRNHRLVLSGSFDEPLLVVDGVEFDSNSLKATSMRGYSPLMSFLETFPPDEIDFIEVLSGGEAAIYGMMGGAGVLVIHTRTRARIDDANKIPLTNLYAVGFTYSPAFKGPDYSIKENRKNNAPDLRSTLYWSGPLITDNEGRATLNFFAADPATTYTVTIKGVTASGDILIKRFLINRK